MNEIHNNDTSLAVLIDADNTSATIIEGLLAEIAKFGVASVKRIYGDWTKPSLSSWKETLLKHSIQPIQQFRYTIGKNATDSAMIIDAMDLLYAGRVHGFCLVSSDSDFTRLAARIREASIKVYGFGQKKTPRPFVSACDKFIYTEVFSVSATEEKRESERKPETELRCDTALIRLIRTAIDATSEEDDWSALSRVGAHISKASTDFDPRNYGFSKLSGLMEAIDLFELERRGNQPYIKDGRKK